MLRIDVAIGAVGGRVILAGLGILRLGRLGCTEHRSRGRGSQVVPGIVIFVVLLSGGRVRVVGQPGGRLDAAGIDAAGDRLQLDILAQILFEQGLEFLHVHDLVEMGEFGLFLRYLVVERDDVAH